MIASKTKSLNQVIKAIVPDIEIEPTSSPDTDTTEFASGALDELARIISVKEIRQLAQQGVEIIGIWTSGGKARLHFARPRAGVPASTGMGGMV